MAEEQLYFTNWLPYRAARRLGRRGRAEREGRSFYFFDLDNNILHLSTRIILFHKKTGKQASILPGELAREEDHVNKAGRYKNYRFIDNDEIGSFQNFRDRHIPLVDQLRGRKQGLIEDIESAMKKPAGEWHGPSWNHFLYAVKNRRPLSIITARGHHPRTLAMALNRLHARGHLPLRPNFLSIYPVTNPTLRHALGDHDRKMSVAALKRIALHRSVELAFKTYGQNPHHRFGVSDDDPRNIREITEALVEMKNRYPANAFFVIDSSGGHIKKTEIFPDHVESSSEIDLADALNYQLFDL